MPASIFTSLLLWSAFLLPGDRPEPSQASQLGQAPRHSQVGSLPVAESTTIQSWPLDRATPWTISEADLEEEESGEGDAEGIVSESYWPWASLGRPKQLFSSRIDRGTVRPSTRSPILRC